MNDTITVTCPHHGPEQLSIHHVTVLDHCRIWWCDQCDNLTKEDR